MKIWNSCKLHLDLRLQQRGHLRQYFPMGMVVQLAHILFPASSLRVSCNAYAGKTTRSALLLRLHLHSTEKSLNSLTFTTRAVLDGRGLVITIVIQDLQFSIDIHLSELHPRKITSTTRHYHCSTFQQGFPSKTPCASNLLLIYHRS